jgi:hypothetical protein
METPGESALRLLTAVETLAAEEEIAIRSSAIVDTIQIQERLEPLLSRLVELCTSNELPPRLRLLLPPRVASVRTRRQASQQLLEASAAAARVSLAKLEVARQQLGNMRSVYGQSWSQPRRTSLEATG